MQKNMYSLILTDAVVEQIDRMAYEKGISRSQMVDHLLAAAAGLSTPEQKTRLLVQQAAERMSTLSPRLQMHIHSDLASMDVITYVKFKYNPSIKYNFDVLNDHGRLLGLLKLTSRSTSVDLRQHLDRFLSLLLQLDRENGGFFSGKVAIADLENDPLTGPTRFARALLLPRLFEKTDDPDVVATLAAEHIMLVHEAMQSYFEHLWSEDLPIHLAQIYARHMLSMMQ